MKRKIAAIFAADIAGYSRLVAEDEEETLRRLASYRASHRRFHRQGWRAHLQHRRRRGAGRISECRRSGAMRDRHPGKPAHPQYGLSTSRQMSFRIGITIGDVVERDGDLLGDGVNIAARLEGLADVGGICVSRAVHEQVANKLSVQFADIGAQEVKNIPNPVHAYMVAMRREDGTYATPQVKKARRRLRQRRTGCGRGYGGDGGVSRGHRRRRISVFHQDRDAGRAREFAFGQQSCRSGAVAVGTALRQRPDIGEIRTTVTARAFAAGSREKFAAETVPFVGDRARLLLDERVCVGGGLQGLRPQRCGGQCVCHRAAERGGRQKCGDRAMPETRGRSSAAAEMRNLRRRQYRDLPAWPSAGTACAVDQARSRRPRGLSPPRSRWCVNAGKARLEEDYLPGRRVKSIAVGPGRTNFFFSDWKTPEEIARRTLGSCGAFAGAACKIVAVDDVFVVPVPTTLKVIGFFHRTEIPRLQRIHETTSRTSSRRRRADGTRSLSVPRAVRACALKATNEQNGVNEALGNCVRHDSECHVIAIGPFSVEPN